MPVYYMTMKKKNVLNINIRTSAYELQDNEHSFMRRRKREKKGGRGEIILESKIVL